MFRRGHLLILLAILVVAGYFGGPHAYAWYHFRAGRSALESYQTASARDHLRSCLKVWSSSADAHLLASRAARRAGDYDEADSHLRECQRLGNGSDEETALEWALLHASMGDLEEVEKFLVDQVNSSPRNAGLIYEALTEGYTRMYRIPDALAAVNHWLQADPDNLRALILRGHTHWQINAMLKAVPDYRKIVERDPEQDDVRWRLALGLLETGQFSEALKHFEELARRKPDDVEVSVRLARCQYLMGQGKQARKLLKSVLDEQPNHGAALRTRGQINLMDGQLDEAEADLQGAIRVLPFDHASHWSLHQVYQRQKKDAEAKVMAERAEKIKENLEKLQSLTTQKMSSRPNDPAVHCEMGKLLLSMGHSEMGRRWLFKALEQDRDYRPAHAALADFYAAQGDSKKAEEHRLLAREP